MLTIQNGPDIQTFEISGAGIRLISTKLDPVRIWQDTGTEYLKKCLLFVGILTGVQLPGIV
jgi:hypothetical protein